MAHHRRGLRQAWSKRGVEASDQRDLYQQLIHQPQNLNTNAADRAMLAYALKLTSTPARVVEQDIIELRRQEFDDRAIHDICAIAAYFAFVNRIANGLGVELEFDANADVLEG